MIGDFSDIIIAMDWLLSVFLAKSDPSHSSGHDLVMKYAMNTSKRFLGILPDHSVCTYGGTMAGISVN